MSSNPKKSLKKSKKLGTKIVTGEANVIRRLSAYCVAKEYNLQRLARFLGERTVAVHASVIGCKFVREFNPRLLSNLRNYHFIDPYLKKIDEDLTSLEIIDSLGYIFVFDSGVITFWNLTEAEEKAIIAEIRNYEFKPHSDIIENDTVNYQDFQKMFENENLDPRKYIARDHLILSGDSFEEKLAVSYGFAQSVKLGYFETDIEASIDDARKLAEDLDKEGEVKISNVELNKKIGSLYLKKNEINLDTNLLDVPDFLWNNEKYQKNFNLILRYFEVEKRTQILNHRLNIISDLLYLLSEEINVRHVSYLDMIIIILLSINVGILLFWDIICKDILGYYTR